MPPHLRVETLPAATVVHQNWRLTPFVQRVRFRWGGLSMLWQWPASLLVISPMGEEHIIPIPNLTRRLLWMLCGLALVSWLIVSFEEQRLRLLEHQRK